MPDLVIVDGGRGQVSAAKEVLDELGLGDLPLVGLAKEREELILPDRDDAGRAAGHLARRCTSSSGCATRRTGSRSRTTATCATGRRSSRRSTTCPAWARSASGSCSRSSARRSGCVRRRSSRSRPCRASAGRSRSGSRPTWRPDASCARRHGRHDDPDRGADVTVRVHRRPRFRGSTGGRAMDRGEYRIESLERRVRHLERRLAKLEVGAPAGAGNQAARRDPGSRAPTRAAARAHLVEGAALVRTGVAPRPSRHRTRSARRRSRPPAPGRSAPVVPPSRPTLGLGGLVRHRRPARRSP